MSGRLFILAVAGYLLALLDVITTGYVINRWGIDKEQNPLMRYSLAEFGIGWTLLVKQFISFIFCFGTCIYLSREFECGPGERKTIAYVVLGWYNVSLLWGLYLFYNNMNTINALAGLK